MFILSTTLLKYFLIFNRRLNIKLLYQAFFFFVIHEKYLLKNNEKVKDVISKY